MQGIRGFVQLLIKPLAIRTSLDGGYALKMGPGKFGIFDTFPDEIGRNAHLSGEIAKALFAKAEELLAEPPTIEQPEILAVKTPGA